MDDKTSVKPHVSPILATPPIQRLGQFATLFRVYQIQKKKNNKIIHQQIASKNVIELTLKCCFAGKLAWKT